MKVKCSGSGKLNLRAKEDFYYCSECDKAFWTLFGKYIPLHWEYITPILPKNREVYMPNKIILR